MARPLSIDLRNRIVAAHETGATCEEIAEKLSIGRASVSRVLRRNRECDGTLEPEPHGGGHLFLVAEDAYPELRALVAEMPDRTAQELCYAWAERTGVDVSRSTMQRTLHRADLTWRKNSSRRPSNSRNASKSSGHKS
jgi:transposase